MYDLSKVGLKDGMVIHCPDKEMAKALFNELNKRKWTWIGEGVLDSNNTCWMNCGHDTCYGLNSNGVVYGNINYFKSKNIPIKKFVDLLNLSIDTQPTSYISVSQEEKSQKCKDCTVAKLWSLYLQKEITDKDYEVMKALSKFAEDNEI